MKEYRPRLADKELMRSLNALGAVLITGPKWCGKTTTAEQVSKSAIYLQDTDRSDEYMQMMKIKPSLLLEGDTPRLIDEWQMAPELWDAVRHSVDRRSKEGLYILTGSTAVDESKIIHSGTGRIGRMRMSTMSLYESGDSNGSVSLAELFTRKEVSGRSALSIDDIASLITRGGWPKTIGKSNEVAGEQIKGYCETIVDSDVKTPDGVDRDSRRMRQVLRSISRNISTPAADTTILADMGGTSMHINTLRSYMRALRSIYVIDDLPAWTPKLRSKTTIRTSATRHLTDPSIAAYFLGASANNLLTDPRTFCSLFKSLVVRDLRAYTRPLRGDVFHYKDSEGLEVDAIIHLRDGRWGAVEAKLGEGMIDDAADNLKKIKNRVESETRGAPSFLAVVTGTEYAYTREDGIHVIPIGCLKD